MRVEIHTEGIRFGRRYGRHGRHGGPGFSAGFLDEGRHESRRERCGAGQGDGHGPRGGSFADGPFGGNPFGGGSRGGGGGPRGEGPRGGGRRKRLFDQVELQTLLLALIAQTPRHGYDLIREIETLSGGEYAPSPGIVYPALSYMEEADLIAPVANETARKAFDVTDEGRAKVNADAEKAAELLSRLSALAAERTKLDPAPIRRAVHALRTAVHDRLSQDGADRALILSIADAIDEATRKIERIET